MAKENLENDQGFVDEQARREAEALALVIGSDYNMKVKFGTPGGGSHWDFVNNETTLDPSDYKPGVAVHEGNHRLVSRAEHVQDLWQEPGFSFGYNAVEDPRANQAGMFFNPGTRPWIQEYIEDDLSEGGGLDYKSINLDTKNKIGYVPKHMQWGGEIIKYWYKKEFTDDFNQPDALQKFLEDIPDEGVREKVAGCITSFEEYYQTIPEQKDEMEVQRKARESSQKFRDKIWPQYQELVEQSYNDQSLVEMLEDMLSQDQPQSSGSAGNSIPFNSLPQDVQDEITQKIKEAVDKKQQQAGQEQRNSNDEENQDSRSGDQSSSGENQGSPKVPWDELSEKAKQAVQEVFDQSPEDKQQEYQEKAKATLEGVEDDANEKLRGKMNDPRYTQTNKERKENDQQKQERYEQQAEAQKIIEEMQKKQEETLAQVPTNSYFEVLNSSPVAGILRAQDRAYKRIFTPDEEPDVRYSYSGLRPSMRRSMQFEADKKRSNVFEIKGRPLEKSHRFLWLIDMSSSMSNIIPLVFEAVVINAELDNRHGLEDAIVGFTDGFPQIIRVYKDFNVRRLNNEAREEIGKMISEFRSHASGTPTIEATTLSYRMLKERMRRRPMQHNYLITLTDGQPNTGAPSLSQLISVLRKDKTVITCGFGIGPGTKFVDTAYPLLHDRIRRDVAKLLGKDQSQVGNSFKDAVEFARASVIIMGYMVEHPELFYS